VSRTIGYFRPLGADPNFLVYRSDAPGRIFLIGILGDVAEPSRNRGLPYVELRSYSPGCADLLK
jgi:hypothetical protein